MITAQQAIMTRLTGDTAVTVSLQALLGGSGRIYHAEEQIVPNAPGIVFKLLTSVPNSSNQGDDAQVINEIYQFSIYSVQQQQIMYRLLRLMDNYTYPDTTEVGGIRSVWEWTGPEMFDDDLKVARLDMRFRFTMAPLAQAAI